LRSGVHKRWNRFGKAHIVTSCGSGVTAGILTLALTELGTRDHALYDGSWTEWGASGQEVVTGAPA
jgi:thiosulfate/3-mercaptopyruvate sulfurtransferase